MCDKVDEYIGRRLLCRRRALGLTQDQLGAAISVRLQQIQRYECAANKVSASRLWQLAEALDVPITYFFEGLGDTQALEEDGRPRARGLRSTGRARILPYQICRARPAQ